MQKLLQAVKPQQDNKGKFKSYNRLTTIQINQLETKFSEPALQCITRNSYIRKNIYVDGTLSHMRIDARMTIPIDTFLITTPKLIQIIQKIINLI